MFSNPFRRKAPPEVLDGLGELWIECIRADDMAGARFASDMLLYAEIGRGRRKLTMMYVERARQHVTEMRQLAGQRAA